MKDCKARKSESTGVIKDNKSFPANTLTHAKLPNKPAGVTVVCTDSTAPLDYLLSSSGSEGDINAVRVLDNGSIPQLVSVDVEGVTAQGIVDTAADITIMGGTLFKKVAAVARLRKKSFKPCDKRALNYDRQPIQLDGRIDLDITFGDKTMKTPVYIKMNAHEQLLLSEGVCRQLNIVVYHDHVQAQKHSRQSWSNSTNDVSVVHVKLVNTARLLPHQSMVVQAKVVSTSPIMDPLLVESVDQVGLETGLQVEDALVQPGNAGLINVVISNLSGCSTQLQEDTVIGKATTASLIESVSETSMNSPTLTPASVLNIQSVEERHAILEQCIPTSPLLDQQQSQALWELLKHHHAAFCLDDNDRGETDLLEMEIDTDGHAPRKVAPRRMPFAVRQEVATQLKKMQASGVIVPSISPWSSPVVMVRKKDGTLRFCVDYRHLNQITKKDTFPLPRVDDLLDQLGESRYFSTLDLASGYWQIRVAPESQEKTAFVTPHGLFQFRVMPFGLTNAPAVFQRLMQRVLMGLNPLEGRQFVSVYIDDVLIFSETLTDHMEHLRLVIQRIEQVGLKLKPGKCRFVCDEVEYLGHVLTPIGVKPNSNLVSAVSNFPQPTDITSVRQFLGLSSYYRRFIKGFASIAQPLTQLTRKNVSFQWTPDHQEAFDILKQRLTTAPILSYPSFNSPFLLETDASIKGIGAVLSQCQDDNHPHPVAYSSRSLTAAERNYSITELETLAVVWAVSHFHSYLYGQDVTIYTDHAAVHAILNTPTPSGKHARWWSKVYGSGISSVTIVYRPGKSNVKADALSRNPQGPAPSEGVCENEFQVAAVNTTTKPSISSLLLASPTTATPLSFGQEQKKDHQILQLCNYLEQGILPEDPTLAKKLVAQASLFAIVDDTLYYIDPKHNHRQRAVVPQHLQELILMEAHRGVMSGHFSGKRTFTSLACHWWWEGMYSDTMKYVANCPECTISAGKGKGNIPPLHPIPVSRPFQVMGIDLMELPRTKKNNKYVVVIQDYLTKWPLAYALPDQKATTLARVLVDEVVPFVGVPEALLSDRGTNLLSHLMTDICAMLGITKLNTTAYHPQCDGMVERFNRTLKAMLRKHASRFGHQWDCYLPSVLWAYRNIPHESTGEKPSFLLFGVDLRNPTESAFLSPSHSSPTTLEDYRQELMISLGSARELAVEAVQRAQERYKRSYDKHSKQVDYHIGDWIFIYFPAVESGRNRKLSHPWHGPYRVVGRKDPDITATKVYFPTHSQIQVHQQRVCRCPPELIPGYYWYGSKQHSLGSIPKWVQELQNQETLNEHNTASHIVHSPATALEDGYGVSQESQQLPDIPTSEEDHDVSHQFPDTPATVETCDHSFYHSIVSHDNEKSMSIASHSAMDHNDRTPSMTGFDGCSGESQRVRFRANSDLERCPYSLREKTTIPARFQQ